MVSQNLILNKVLNTRDLSIITLNNLTEKYFFNYKAEFLFIVNHYQKYNVVPDKIVFLNNFPDFDLQEVNEPDNYLLESLYKDYNTSYLATRFNNIKKMLENDKTDEALKYFMDSAEEVHTGAAISCTDILHNTDDRYQAYLDRTNDYSKFYITTGFEELDRILGGWDRQEEYGLIVARTNTGKSFVAIKMAVAAAKQGLKVGYYSGEMTSRKVGYRVDTLLGNISNGALIHGNLDINLQYQNYIKSLPAITGKLLILTPNDIAGPADIPALRAFIEKEKLDILFIDQISLLEDARHGKTPVEKVSNISKDIKNLQVMSRIPIIAVCQQNRTKNEDGSQDTTQIAQSDRLGQDCTVALFLDRDKNNKDMLKIYIGKSRDSVVGSTLCYQVDFNNGHWNYVPSEEDSIEMSDEKATELSNSYLETPDFAEAHESNNTPNFTWITQ